MSLGFEERKQKHRTLAEEEYMNAHAGLCVHQNVYTMWREIWGEAWLYK